MRKMRLLVVDDSVVVRRVLARTLADDPAIGFVSTAPNGRIALAKIAQDAPDLVTLDVEMPEMDGLTTLAALRKTNPFLPVIMFSVYTEPGSAATLDALASGAVDFVTKPPNGASADVASRVIREDLLPKIKLHFSNASGRRTPIVSAPTSPQAPSNLSASAAPVEFCQPVDIVVIGVSTGGPSALDELFTIFPENFPVPILIVQHMPPVFTTLLAERLAAKSRICVAEAHANPILTAGHAWLAPGGNHMIVERVEGETRIKVFQGPPENSCRPSVDVLFRSAAEVFGPNVLAVVMTGMGQDGFRGCQRIREAGGQILAQDQASSVVWGMPGFVAHAGLVDRLLPLNELGPEILRRVMDSRKSANPQHPRLPS